MSEAYAIRILDAYRHGPAPFVRKHDGVRLVAPRNQLRMARAGGMRLTLLRRSVLMLRISMVVPHPYGTTSLSSRKTTVRWSSAPSSVTSAAVPAASPSSARTAK
jgi:hypothetical protein